MLALYALCVWPANIKHAVEHIVAAADPGHVVVSRAAAGVSAGADLVGAVLRGRDRLAVAADDYDRHAAQVLRPLSAWSSSQSESLPSGAFFFVLAPWPWPWPWSSPEASAPPARRLPWPDEARAVSRSWPGWPRRWPRIPPSPSCRLRPAAPGFRPASCSVRLPMECLPVDRHSIWCRTQLLFNRKRPERRRRTERPAERDKSPASSS